MITVIELPEFIKRVEKTLSIKEIEELLFFLSANPKAGTFVPGTGGIRKLRWSSKGKGKSGGSRVIYFYWNDTIPLFLLTIFNKNEKENLSKSERNELSSLTNQLIESYRRII